MMFPKAPRPLRSRKHMAFVASLPCAVCFRQPVQSHHLLRTTEKGMGRKSGDDKAIPLCFEHHREIHDDGNEPKILSNYSIDGPALAAALFADSGNTSKCLNILRGQ